MEDVEDIWSLKPSEEDLLTGARYASMTLPWTFNRMMFTTSSKGQRLRALNISKGIVAQEVLKRALEEEGVRPIVQRKSHRAEDFFDFHIPIRGRDVKFDVKSYNYYSDYPVDGRPPFSPDLVVDNADYPGPDWRYFFPMLVPHTQIRQDKEAYCFSIASSIDFRTDLWTNRSANVLTAFPYDEFMGFTSSKKLILAREEANLGFYLDCAYLTESYFDGREVTAKIIGEWGGSLKEDMVHLEAGDTARQLGPYSSLDAVLMEGESYQDFYGQLQVSVSGNEFKEPVRNSKGRNVNVPPQDALHFERGDFCNLVLPDDYEFHFLGWIEKDRFLAACRHYTGWVWPDDDVNRFENRPWTQITQTDRRTIERADFSDSLQSHPPLVAAGWMKTTGRGNGACCYFYPNTYGGGVRETNLYILPKDLNTMDSLATSSEA